MSKDYIPATLEQWRSRVGRALANYGIGVDVMPADKVSRKFHLQNIKEWLALANTPIRKAQDATAEALKEHYEGSDTDAGVIMADIARFVNMALAWVMHAQGLTIVLLGEIEAPPDVVTASSRPYVHPYYCDLCELNFGADEGFVSGDPCPKCCEGTIALAIPF